MFPFAVAEFRVVCVKFCKFDQAYELPGFWFFKPAPNNQQSSRPPKSRINPENGSNRDSSEAIRSGFGGLEG